MRAVVSDADPLARSVIAAQGAATLSPQAGQTVH